MPANSFICNYAN